mmetsp:Transcript_113541/g.317151  ORF Transcript_113541/g.317151 Transcript_113541/m.317151 type:complete len:216 (+) Transcript_113541:1405-2052(+)
MSSLTLMSCAEKPPPPCLLTISRTPTVLSRSRQCFTGTHSIDRTVQPNRSTIESSHSVWAEASGACTVAPCFATSPVMPCPLGMLKASPSAGTHHISSRTSSTKNTEQHSAMATFLSSCEIASTYSPTSALCDEIVSKKFMRGLYSSCRSGGVSWRRAHCEETFGAMTRSPESVCDWASTALRTTSPMHFIFRSCMKPVGDCRRMPSGAGGGSRG